MLILDTAIDAKRTFAAADAVDATDAADAIDVDT